MRRRTVIAMLKGTALVVVTAVAVTMFPRVVKEPLPVVMGGWVAPGFEVVANTFRHLLETGQEHGGSFAVYHHGQLVVDLWGGYADWNTHQPWTNYTMSKWFSVTKAVSSIVVARLADRGLLDYEKPVSYYWSEFSQQGKGNITVKQLLSHQAGLLVIDEQYAMEPLLKDPITMGTFLAKQAPNWEPGEYHGYHAITFGPYVDQLVRRVDPRGRGIKELFRDDLGNPFDIDFHIGLPREFHYRAASLDSSFLPRKSLFAPLKYWKIIFYFITHPGSLVGRLLRHPRDLLKFPLEGYNRPERRELDFASAQGYGTARAVAKMFGILGNNGIHGNQTILNMTIINKFRQPVADGYDEIILDHSMFSHGMKLYRRFEGTEKERILFGHPGIGGQMALADTIEGLGWGYVTNCMSIHSDGDYPVYLQLEHSMYEAVWNLNRTGHHGMSALKEGL